MPSCFGCALLQSCFFRIPTLYKKYNVITQICSISALHCNQWMKGMRAFWEVRRWKGWSRLSCCGGKISDVGQPANQAVFADIWKSCRHKHTHTEGRRERCTGRTRNSRKITILDIPRHTSSDTQTTICGLVVGVSFLFFSFCFCCSLQQKVYTCERVCVDIRIRMVLSTQGLRGGMKRAKEEERVRELLHRW